MEEGKRRGGALAALLAVGALGIAAVPAYGALSDGSTSSRAPQQSAPSFVQEEGEQPQRPRERPRDEDCPFKDGQGRGGEGNGGSQGEGGGSAPEGVSSDSASLY